MAGAGSMVRNTYGMIPPAAKGGDIFGRMLIGGEKPLDVLRSPDPTTTLFLGTPEQKKDVPLVALFDVLKGNQERLPTALGMPERRRR